jgi:pyruvate/2-oxoglutarate dehydrogenase complex dihydrolipoamide dehydrogenase (E3) component
VERVFDAVIVGAGQAGPSLAGRLTAAGWSVALIEKERLGGTCVNTGCTPTKAMVASARAAYTAAHGSEYGLVGGEAVRVDLRKVKARKDAIVANSRAKNEAWVGSMKGCTLIYGTARFESHDRLGMPAMVFAKRCTRKASTSASAPNAFACIQGPGAPWCMSAAPRAALK